MPSVSRIQAQIQSAVADGRVDAAEVSNLLSQGRADPALKGMLLEHASKFDADAKQALEAAIGAAPAAAELTAILDAKLDAAKADGKGTSSRTR
jgi:hypothetical protein